MKSPSILLSIVAAVTMTFGLSTSSVYADCPGDLNNNNVVDGVDLTILTTNWGGSGSGDINGDGSVGGADLALLIGHWGPCGFGGPPMGITLVIDPTHLGLPLGCSAWVAGFANVSGGGLHNLPFKALKPSTSTLYAASFEEWTTTAPLPMIQIYGGSVTGTTTTIWTGTSEMDGGQLQIFVSPIGTAPDGPSALWNGRPTTVTVQQINSPPFSPVEMDGPTFVPFDIVEFTYLPNSTSTFDVSGVNCFVVPMTMTPQQSPSLGSVGINTNISRDRIGTAYTTFMNVEYQNDPDGKAAFQSLLYESSGQQPADPCYATAPSAPDQQFFAIVNPWFWINRNNTCNPNTTFWNTYWDVVLDEFFKDGNKLKINVGGTVEYTGTCAMDSTSQVLTYTFQNEAVNPPTDVMNGACTTVPTVLKLPKPSSTVLTRGSYVSQAAALLFGNTPEIFPCPIFPDNDGGQIIDAILEAFGRGVALDGLNPQPIQISTATSTFFPPTGPGLNPRGLATITTLTPHNIPGDTTHYEANITGVSVDHYNSTQPSAPYYELTTLTPTTFTFQYQIDLDANNSVMNGAPLSTYIDSTHTTNVTVNINHGYVPKQNEVVYFVWQNDVPFYTGQHTVTERTSSSITIIIQGNHLWSASPAGGIIWSGLYADGTGGTVAPVGASSVAWNNFNNWYGAPGNPTHTPQAYNTYSKFLHYSTIEGTDSRLTSPHGTPIFIDNKAYGFALDETPAGPYSGKIVSPKFERQINDGSTINLTLSPWVVTP